MGDDGRPTIRLRRRGVLDALKTEKGRRVARGVATGLFVVLVLLGWALYRPHYHGGVIRRRMAAAEEMRRSGNAEAAIQEYVRLETDYPKSPVAKDAAAKRGRLEGYCFKANVLKKEADRVFKSGDSEKAVTIYREVIALYPESVQATKAMATEPLCARLACEDLSARAQEAAESKLWGEARDLYARVLTVDDSYEGAQAGLERAMENLEKFDEFLERARTHEGARGWREAMAEYDRALEVMPPSAAAWEGRTGVLKEIPPPEGMVLILPGEFIMGTDGGEKDERPRRTAKTDGFYMDRTEVTNREYARFVKAANRRPPRHWHGPAPSPDIAELPVVCVSWYDATAYAEWAGKRLATEMEWERAARGREGRKYPWGMAFKGDAGIFSFGPQLAGRTETDRSEEGCMDMGGNVSEWTADEYRVPARRRDGAHLPAGYKYVRGASWAGLEKGRAEPVIAAAEAGAESDPMILVLTDHHEMWGVEASSLSRVSFFLRDVADRLAMVEMFKWLPRRGDYVSERFPIYPGKEIAGEKSVASAGAGGGERVRVRFETGCRLLRVHVGGKLQAGWMAYFDRYGVERRMTVSGATVRKSSKEPRRRTRRMPRSRRGFEGMRGGMEERSLAFAARSANRMLAPPEARFINCGFRCVRDP